jgi:hypothetical protein
MDRFRMACSLKVTDSLPGKDNRLHVAMLSPALPPAICIEKAFMRT